MKRKGFIGLIAATAPLLARAAFAGPGRLAITITSEDNTLSAMQIQRLIDGLTGRLISSNHFQVVDRQRLAAVIAEQGFSNSYYADPKTAAALGRIVGASRILTVVASLEVDDNSGALVSDREADVSASYQLVGVDTARIVAAGTAEGSSQKRSGSSTSGTRLANEAIDDCADDLAQKLTSSA